MIGLTVVSLLNHYFFQEASLKKVPYSEFKTLLKDHKIKEIKIYPDHVQGKLVSDSAFGDSLFQSVRIEDPDLIKDLTSAGVSYSGEIENTFFKELVFGWVLPLGIFFLLWNFMFRKINPGGGILSIGKSRAKMYNQSDTGITFEDVAGIDEAKEELKEIVDFLKSPEKFKKIGGKIPKGVLLVGSPGTGKTLLAKALAGEAKVPFYSISGSDFVEMFVGVGAARVRDLFQQAQTTAPCIVFIDEIDAIGRSRSVGMASAHEEREQTLNQMLAEMDGFDPNVGVIVVAATNRPEVLDQALLRPGRFDRHIAIDKPNLKGREQILRVHAKKVKLAKDVDLKVVAQRTPGLAGADLANTINEAALLAARENKNEVSMIHFEKSIDRVLAGVEKKGRVMNAKEKEVTAYHEAGHTVVAMSLESSDPVHKVSIIPRGIGALGFTLQLPTEDRYMMTKSELIDRMAVLFGGRLAEKLVFNEISTGAENDLKRATEIAKSMVKEYGMSDALGLVTYDRERRPLFLDVPQSSSAGDYSAKTSELIDQEIDRFIKLSAQKAEDVLVKHRDKLEQVAQRLLEVEVIESEELKQIFAHTLH